MPTGVLAGTENSTAVLQNVMMVAEVVLNYLVVASR